MNVVVRLHLGRGPLRPGGRYYAQAFQSTWNCTMCTLSFLYINSPFALLLISVKGDFHVIGKYLVSPKKQKDDGASA